MRILITGKNSYIGNSFKTFLNDKPEYQVNEISVRDDSWRFFSFKGYDVVIHLAALVHQNERKYHISEYEKVNVKLTFDIANKALNDGVKKFIFFSSMAVFGKTKEIKRNSPLVPITKYGITKLKAEEVMKSLVKGSKMSLTIIRPPMIYGPGAKGNPNFIEKLSKFSCIFPESFNIKSFLSIDKLNLILLENLSINKNIIIHPKDSKNQTTFQLFQYYRSIINKKAYPMKILGYLLRILSFIGFIKKVFGDLYYDFDD